MGLCLDPLRLLWWGLLAAVVRDSLLCSCPGLMDLYGACGGRWLPEHRQYSGLSCLIFMGEWVEKLTEVGLDHPQPLKGSKISLWLSGVISVIVNTLVRSR